MGNIEPDPERMVSNGLNVLMETWKLADSPGNRRETKWKLPFAELETMWKPEVNQRFPAAVQTKESGNSPCHP